MAFWQLVTSMTFSRTRATNRHGHPRGASSPAPPKSPTHPTLTSSLAGKVPCLGLVAHSAAGVTAPQPMAATPTTMATLDRPLMTIRVSLACSAPECTSPALRAHPPTVLGSTAKLGTFHHRFQI